MNIFTARLDLKNLKQQDSVVSAFQLNKKLITILIFREQKKTNKIFHLHIRVETKQTFRTFQTFISKKLPMFKGTSKATRNCIKKDKDLISSATYIAKEGLCIYNRGHTLDQVNEYIRIGNEKWKLSQLKKRLPIYQQVITLMELTAACSTRHIIRSYYNFFVKYKNRRFPPKFKREVDIQQILFNLSPTYLNHWIDRQVEKTYSYTSGRTDRTMVSYFGPNRDEITETEISKFVKLMHEESTEENFSDEVSDNIQ